MKKKVRRQKVKVRQLSHKTIGFKSAPWLTGELTIVRKKINAIRRRYQRTIHDSNLRETRKLQYLQEKKEVRSDSKEREDIAMEAILQCHKDNKSVEHGLQAGYGQNQKQQHTLNPTETGRYCNLGYGRDDQLHDGSLHTGRRRGNERLPQTNQGTEQNTSRN